MRSLREKLFSAIDFMIFRLVHTRKTRKSFLVGQCCGTKVQCQLPDVSITDSTTMSKCRTASKLSPDLKTFAVKGARSRQMLNSSFWHSNSVCHGADIYFPGPYLRNCGNFVEGQHRQSITQSNARVPLLRPTSKCFSRFTAKQMH